MFSIGQIIGDAVFQDDFRKRFSGLDGAVALDLDERFEGREPGFKESMAIKHTVVWMD